MKSDTVFDKAFTIRRDCLTITDADDSSTCLKENQTYFDLFERTLAESKAAAET